MIDVGFEEHGPNPAESVAKRRIHSSGESVSSPKNPRSHRRSAGDKTRRGRWLDALAVAPLSRGARAWALHLAHRSSVTAKPVWGYQIGQAQAIGCSDRQVRRYRKELEEAGLIETQRGRFERRPNGTIGRTFTNLYRFVVAPLVRRKKSSSDRPDTHGRSNPSPKGELITLPKIPVLFDASTCHVDDFGPDDPFEYVLARA